MFDSLEGNELNLSVGLQTISMQPDLFAFLTPQPKNSESSLMMSTNRASQRGSSRRKPIFSEGKPRSKFSQSIVFNRDHEPFEKQLISANQVLNFDFCGCESKMTPCQVIDETFLKDVSLRELKQSYMDVTEASESNRLSDRKRNLFKSLPKTYPQIFFTHLNNLLKAIEGELSPAEFNCLAWIQYHTKIEYATYFLYEDLKKAYTQTQKFMDSLDYELGKLRFNFHTIRADFCSRGYDKTFDSFVRDFYSSVGANIVPVTQYANLIRLIYKKGQKILIKLLVHFLTAHAAELSEGLRFLAHGEDSRYWIYMRELNWDIYMEELQV